MGDVHKAGHAGLSSDSCNAFGAVDVYGLEVEVSEKTVKKESPARKSETDLVA